MNFMRGAFNATWMMGLTYFVMWMFVEAF